MNTPHNKHCANIQNYHDAQDDTGMKKENDEIEIVNQQEKDTQIATEEICDTVKSA